MHGGRGGESPYESLVSFRAAPYGAARLPRALSRLIFAVPAKMWADGLRPLYPPTAPSARALIIQGCALRRCAPTPRFVGAHFRRAGENVGGWAAPIVSAHRPSARARGRTLGARPSGSLESLGARPARPHARSWERGRPGRMRSIHPSMICNGACHAALSAARGCVRLPPSPVMVSVGSATT